LLSLVRAKEEDEGCKLLKVALKLLLRPGEPGKLRRRPNNVE
jgi:hypothetical protein